MTNEQHEELLERIGQLETSIDLAVELMHDQHAWLVAAFSALGVTVTEEQTEPRKTSVMRLVHGFKGKKVPDKGD